MKAPKHRANKIKDKLGVTGGEYRRIKHMEYAMVDNGVLFRFNHIHEVIVKPETINEIYNKLHEKD